MKTYTDEELKEFVKILEIPLENAEGDVVGKTAIFNCLSSDEPWEVLDYAIYKYTDGQPHNQFMDISCCNPWQRVVISHCYGELEWQIFDDYLKDGGKSHQRNKIISQILKNN
jgi:hypothetical protein